MRPLDSVAVIDVQAQMCIRDPGNCTTRRQRTRAYARAYVLFSAYAISGI